MAEGNERCLVLCGLCKGFDTYVVLQFVLFIECYLWQNDKVITRFKYACILGGKLKRRGNPVHDVHESVDCDMIMKVIYKMQHYSLRFVSPCIIVQFK